MELFKRITHTPRNLALCVGLAAIGALGAAMVMQFGFGLYPCTLCIYQRIPFVVLVILSIGIWFFDHRKATIALMLLACITLAISAGLGGYHMGVEKGVFEGTSSCSPETDGNMSIDDLKAMIESAPIASCSDVAAEFLGFSIAGWNMLFSLFLLFTQLYGTQHFIRKHKA